ALDAEPAEAAEVAEEAAFLDSPPTPVKPAATGAPAGMIRFRCGCGAVFQAAREHATQPARCTRCGDVLFIPTRAQAVRANYEPVKVSFDAKDRYRPGKDPGVSMVPFFIVVLLLLLLGGGGFAYWQFYARDAVARD